MPNPKAKPKKLASTPEAHSQPRPEAPGGVFVLNEETGAQYPVVPLSELVIGVVSLAQALAEKKFYPYQVQFAYRIVESLLLRDGAVITALLARQVGKCHAKGTKLLMFDGTVRAVEDIKVGDVLMGDDSTPRTVLSLARGREQMYAVRPRCNYAEEYVVNASHILSLKGRKGEVIDMSIAKYLAEPKSKRKDYWKGYKVAVQHAELPTPVDPYWFGLWFGDGKRSDTRIYTRDSEVVSYICRLADLNGYAVSVYDDVNGKCPAYALTSNGKPNAYLSFVKKHYGGEEAKHIPHVFLANSLDVRRKVLAGIIDSDGHKPLQVGKESTCEICQSTEEAAYDVLRLARSVGLRASIKRRNVSCQTGAKCVAYRIHLYGDLSCIPTRIARKKYRKAPLRENPLTFGFDLVKKGVADYYGFTLSGNHRYVMADYTVTHNTESLAAIISAILVALPLLAQRYPNDWRLNLTDNEGRYRGFRNGVRVGIYAPKLSQSEIMYNRVKLFMDTKTARRCLSEQGLEIEVSNGDTLRVSHGSRLLCQTASDKAKIEGETHHLLVLEEAQDIGEQKIKKSLSPMVAATKGSTAMIGTASTKKCVFYERIKQNERLELAGGPKNHFQYSWRVCAQYNSLYLDYVLNEQLRLGTNSDEFRMSYEIEWLFERGMFVSQTLLLDPRIALSNGEPFSVTHTSISPVLTGMHVVAGIDWGKEHDSTVVTLVAVDWTNPLQSLSASNERGSYNVELFQRHVLCWKEWQGDNYEYQFAEIMAFLRPWRSYLRKVVTDSTGPGAPMYDRLVVNLESDDVEVIPFNFNPKSKSDGYKALYSELCGFRLTFPASKAVRDTNEFRRFVNQTLDLVKSYKEGLMVVSHPDEKHAHDDYPTSLMLANWGTLVRPIDAEVDFSDVNYFFRR